MKRTIKIVAGIAAAIAAILAGMAIICAPMALSITCTEAMGQPAEEWISYARFWAIISLGYGILGIGLLVYRWRRVTKTYQVVVFGLLAATALLWGLGFSLEMPFSICLGAFTLPGQVIYQMINKVEAKPEDKAESETFTPDTASLPFR